MYQNNTRMERTIIYKKKKKILVKNEVFDKKSQISWNFEKIGKYKKHITL